MIDEHALQHSLAACVHVLTLGLDLHALLAVHHAGDFELTRGGGVDQTHPTVTRRLQTAMPAIMRDVDVVIEAHLQQLIAFGSVDLLTIDRDLGHDAISPRNVA